MWAFLLLVFWTLLSLQTPTTDAAVPHLSLAPGDTLPAFYSGDEPVAAGIRGLVHAEDGIEPLFINTLPETSTVRRLKRRISEQAGQWWVYNALNENAWFFQVQANSTGLTADQLEASIIAQESLVTAPVYSLYGELICSTPARMEAGPFYSLPPVPVHFVNGQGWASLQICLKHEYYVGDGPECGGYGAAYVPLYWYSFTGLAADHAAIINASVPLVIRDTPRTEVSVNYCSSADGESTTTYTPTLEEWEALGWHEEEWPPRLTPEAEAAFAAAAIDELEQALKRDPEAGTLAGAFAALNETFATLEYEPAG